MLHEQCFTSFIYDKRVGSQFQLPYLSEGKILLVEKKITKNFPLRIIHRLVQEILIMKLPSKIINYFQQLVSLLLYTVRHEVAPHDVLNERPNGFRCGYQQDSFEYLGFLLDQNTKKRNDIVLLPWRMELDERLTQRLPP